MTRLVHQIKKQQLVPHLRTLDPRRQRRENTSQVQAHSLSVGTPCERVNIFLICAKIDAKIWATSQRNKPTYVNYKANFQPVEMHICFSVKSQQPKTHVRTIPSLLFRHKSFPVWNGNPSFRLCSIQYICFMLLVWLHVTTDQVNYESRQTSRKVRRMDNPLTFWRPSSTRLRITMVRSNQFHRFLR